MAPTSPPHASVVDRLARLLISRLGTRAIVRVQGAVPARPHSLPQPDVAVLAERHDFYRNAHPEAAEIHLIVEVADTTLRRDRDKLRLYATAGMQEVWIVDINDGRVEVYRAPAAATYTERTVPNSASSLTSQGEETMGAPSDFFQRTCPSVRFTQ